MTHGRPPKEAQISPSESVYLSALLDKLGEIVEDSLYAVLTDKTSNPKSTEDFRNKANELVDRATTAAAAKGTTDLSAVISQVGKNAVALQNLYPMVTLVSAILSGAGSSTGNSKITSGRKKIIEDALTGAIVILIKKWGYDKVINVFNAVLENNGLQFIDKDYIDIVKNALANVSKLAAQFGPNNIPIYEYSTVETIGKVPTPLVTVVPDMYVQEYYIQREDPYPGFIKWNSSDQSTYVFTERKIGDKYYISPQEEVYSISEQQLAEDLDPYIDNENLTAKILNDLLDKQNNNVGNNMDEKTLGKGSGSDSANAQELLQQLLGIVSTITNLQKSQQLPRSVLNSVSVSESLKKFENNTARNNRMAELLDKAVTVTEA